MPKPVSPSPTHSKRIPKRTPKRTLKRTALFRPAQLPVFRTACIGAELQVGRLQALVREYRLVTVLGLGGSGKTRLAVELARMSVLPNEAVTDAPRASAFADTNANDSDCSFEKAVFEKALFVSLVGCVDAAEFSKRLAPALALAVATSKLELRLGHTQDWPGRNLLLLDNCEQLDAAAAQQIAVLAELMPQTHCLLTSRRPMNLDGEREFMVSGLELPKLDGLNGLNRLNRLQGSAFHAAAVAEVATSAAAMLFIACAKAQRANFEVLPSNCVDMAELLRCLDGSPLAIELAAAHARTLNPSQMLALLRSESKAAVASSSATGLAWLGATAKRGQRSRTGSRHASMWQVIDASWQMLTPPAQALLAIWCAMAPGEVLDSSLLSSSADALDELLAHSMLQTAATSDGALKHSVAELVRSFVCNLVRARREVAQTRTSSDTRVLQICSGLPRTQAR